MNLGSHLRYIIIIRGIRVYGSFHKYDFWVYLELLTSEIIPHILNDIFIVITYFLIYIYNIDYRFL